MLTLLTRGSRTNESKPPPYVLSPRRPRGVLHELPRPVRGLLAHLLHPDRGLLRHVLRSVHHLVQTASAAAAGEALKHRAEFIPRAGAARVGPRVMPAAAAAAAAAAEPGRAAAAAEPSATAASAPPGAPARLAHRAEVPGGPVRKQRPVRVPQPLVRGEDDFDERLALPHLSRHRSSVRRGHDVGRLLRPPGEVLLVVRGLRRRKVDQDRLHRVEIQQELLRARVREALALERRAVQLGRDAAGELLAKESKVIRAHRRLHRRDERRERAR
eukprot:31379-Pelagococcus_subviridis.AAC.16